MDEGDNEEAVVVMDDDRCLDLWCFESRGGLLNLAELLFSDEEDNDDDDKEDEAEGVCSGSEAGLVPVVDEERMICLGAVLLR